MPFSYVMLYSCVNSRYLSFLLLFSLIFLSKVIIISIIVCSLIKVEFKALFKQTCEMVLSLSQCELWYSSSAVKVLSQVPQSTEGLGTYQMRTKDESSSIYLQMFGLGQHDLNSLTPRLSTFPLLDYNDDLEHTHGCNCKANRLSSVAVYVRTWWAHEHDITPYCTAHAVVGPGALNFTCVAICVVSGKTLAKLILFGGDAMAHACSGQSHVQGTKAISIAVWPKSDTTPGT